MLDLRDLCLENIKRLCQADLTWELIPLYDCPGTEGKKEEVCSLYLLSTGDIDIFVAQYLFAYTDRHQWQRGDYVSCIVW